MCRASCRVLLLLAATAGACSSTPARDSGVDRAAREAGRDLPRPDRAVVDLRADRAAIDAPRDVALVEGGKLDKIAQPDIDPFPKGPVGCMGTNGPVTPLGSVGNVTVYAGCPGAPQSTFLLVWGGAVGALKQADLSAIKAKHSTALLAIPGVWGHGIGLCCVSSTNEACINLYVSANTTALWDLAAQLDKIFAGEASCFGLMADVPGKLGPRCKPSPNPTECKPVPVCNGLFDPVCCTPPAFNPGATRVPTLPPTSPVYALELPQGAGECTHDGECTLNGCGNHCTAYSAPTFTAICPCYSVLKNSFCGCVSGQCVWYEQK